MGRPTVSSEGQGRGCEFIVTLPVLVDQPAILEREVGKLPEGSDVKRRILVVDDNRDGAESLAMMLELIVRG